MDVTRTNFKDSLPLIQKSITEAKFITIDAEFTGINTPGHLIHNLDTPAERYQKSRKVAQNYVVLQYGICTFNWNKKESKYVCHPFNFYIFPRQFSRQAPDKRFTFQSSCIDFLVSQGFDFNKTFKEGISYLLPSEEQKLRDSLEEKHRNIEAANAAVQKTQQLSSPAFTSPSGDPNSTQISGKGPPQVPDEHKDFIQNICDKITAFKGTDEKELALLPCNGYLRKLIYLTVAQKFPNDVYVESRTNETGRRYQVISKIGNEEEIRQKEALKRSAEVEELNDAVGFSKVIKMISQSGKLVVGHNMLLDLLYTINQFLCPLPEDYDEFKSLIKCVFPRIMDTKLLSNSHPFKEVFFSTVLGDLEKAVKSAPFNKSAPAVECTEDCKYNTQTEKLHEAGYDAYITGIVFSSMANYLGTFQEAKPPVVFPDSKLLQPFTDKLYLMRVYDIPYMNLNEDDLTPDRSHVFHLTFPSEWKTSDISALFSPFGNVQISWLDDVSAFVSLYKKDNAEHVLKTLNKGKTYRIITYEEFKVRERSQLQQNTTIDHIDYHSLLGTPTASTPVNNVANKRKFIPTSDVDLPPREKRRRSRNSSESPFSSNRSITTIVEEAEEDDINNVNGGNKSTSLLQDEEEDIGEPVVKKQKKDDKKDCSDVSKGLFEVPENW